MFLLLLLWNDLKWDSLSTVTDSMYEREKYILRFPACIAVAAAEGLIHLACNKTALHEGQIKKKTDYFALNVYSFFRI